MSIHFTSWRWRPRSTSNLRLLLNAPKARKNGSSSHLVSDPRLAHLGPYIENDFANIKENYGEYWFCCLRFPDTGRVSHNFRLQTRLKTRLSSHTAYLGLTSFA